MLAISFYTLQLHWNFDTIALFVNLANLMANRVQRCKVSAITIDDRCDGRVYNCCICILDLRREQDWLNTSLAIHCLGVFADWINTAYYLHAN